VTTLTPDDFYSIIAISIDGFLLVDLSGNILETNDSYCQMVGYSRDELLNLQIPAIDAIDHKDDVDRRFALIIKNGSLRFETRHLHKDGTVIDVEVSANYSPSHGGSIFSFIRDVSDKKRAEEALRDANDFLRLAQQSAGAGLWDWDMITGQLNWSSELYTLFGLDQAESASTFDVWRDILHPDDKQAAESSIDKAIRDRTQLKSEYRIITPSGDVRWISSIGTTCYDVNGTALRMSGISLDITDNKTAEVALKESEWKFQALFDNGPIGVAYHRMIYDNSGKAVDYFFLDANEKYVELTGVDPRGKTVIQAFPGIENDPFDWIGTFGRVARTGEAIRFEQYLQANDRWYDCVGYQYKPDHFVAAFLEITERKRAEEALKESEFRWKFALEGAGDGVWDWNILSGEAYYSSRYKEMLGFFENEIGNSSDEWLKRIHPDDVTGVMTALKPYLDGKTGTATVEYRMLCKDGSWKSILGRGMVVSSDCDGKPLRMIGTNSDLTDRKQVEAAQRESEEKFRLLFEKAQDGIFLLSAQGDIVSLNTAFARMHGYSIDELLTMGLKDLDTPETALLAPARLQRIFAGESMLFEVEHYCKNGQTILLEASVSLVVIRDNKFVLGFHRDITERRTAEKERRTLELQMQQAQKLESLGVLAGGIAHDFNNILMAIMGNADLALMRINKESPAVENLRRIEQASARAADLAKQMLAYSGKGKFVVENIDLNILLEEMLHMLDVSVSKKAVLRLNPHTPLPSVEADATQMRQIIMNLVINASEAIGDKSGVIAITTGCMDCDRNYLKDVWLDENISEGLYVYLEIADTGCGMDKETMAKLFDPFFTTKFTGRGLGMAAVLGIVRGHKGAIKVYSEPKRGTTFKILLPASSRPTEIFNGASHHDDWKGEGIVLLVDDEETVRGIGTEMLKELGFSVITADDGREGVEAFRNNPDISFVILDLTMPHMDGEQCFRELRQLQPDVKVIMSSGFSEHEVTQKFAGKGLAGFIQKPYKLSVLREAIQKI
jgi:PAS domain S-box-containing protein